MNVQVINKSKHPLPAYATELSAGLDIRANLSDSMTLGPYATLSGSYRIVYRTPLRGLRHRFVRVVVWL